MDHFDCMKVFVAVVEAGGFSAASRKTGIPVATISRKMNELEDALGAQLLIRSTRKIQTTDSGERYYEEIRNILEDIKVAARRAAGEYKCVSGQLTITAPTLFGRLHILPIVRDFLRLHADIRIRLVLSNLTLSMRDDPVDLAFRIGPRRDEPENYFELGSTRQLICASSDFLKLHGCPQTPDDLLNVPFVHFSRNAMLRPVQFRSHDGRPLELDLYPTLITDSAQTAVDAAIDGVGATQVYAYQAEAAVAARQLKIVLTKFEAAPFAVTLVEKKGVRRPMKLATFMEFSKPRLEQALGLVSDICARSTGWTAS
ncbi:LysR family transcriptional regulator [uncultured Shimia sp.]|uniref:LysR family transcriptional regulator n=1 Tax=uncultured Shimia sp. TaxID=573152 RepID=UPI0025EF1E32|nr:LysR family transcriptional regulator [uncultured Shimia sp.]